VLSPRQFLREQPVELIDDLALYRDKQKRCGMAMLALNRA